MQAVSEYVGIKRREGHHAIRTLRQIKHRGLIGAAEESVCKSSPPQGFITLADADLEDLSYEQIVLDYPEEFSPRALWYARRTLGLQNESPKPPSQGNGTKDHGGSNATARRNPPWSRDELILALDLYLRFRHTSVTHDSAEVSGLSAFLGQ